MGEGPQIEGTGGKGDKGEDKGIWSYKPDKRDEQAPHQGGLVWVPTSEPTGNERYSELGNRIRPKVAKDEETFLKIEEKKKNQIKE